MKRIHHGAASLRAALWLAVASSFLFFHLSSAQDRDVCKPSYAWDSLSAICTDADEPWPAPQVTCIHVEPGEINCRYWADTPEEVSSLTCSHLASYYQLPYDRFFFLNPDLKKDCSNIKPKTEYCVAGFIE
ncbi:hypothetical protein LY78DRAFT_669500 [Colletotrichum sublineola]|uniref:LysM domain-containing protein n=1 Tax=Colletotrichum sublineola TaxID=1173701 RepID=A0A066WUK0_COLSU|nr:hypothetical protein LY78DRAFT_669500 [Colletotrichum sublineola]KDN60342.1 hypothetical protein CSUB01_03507 [Colletotrichum sublineola]